ncbi:MAG: phosphocholine cytidylyltransferase family protein [Chloracidobacterium sp.]|nr:phosphocholine cytidylyltransferase family protein [Chloracidobacterium sp.]
MKAILLAAGRSTRLYPITLATPKCLLEVGGRTLLEYQLDALEKCGVDEVVVVTGYCREMIEAKFAEVGPRYSFAVKFVYNELFAETNNIYSLWTAKDAARGSEFLVMHADVLFHADILVNCCEQAGDIVLVADKHLHEETMKLVVADGRVTSVGKHVKFDEASGTFLGIAKFSSQGGEAMFDELDRVIEAGETNAYFTRALMGLIATGEEIGVSWTEGKAWIEVDFPEELEQAENVLPQIIR